MSRKPRAKNDRANESAPNISDTIDLLITETLDAAVCSLGLKKKGWAVVAVGGYGRRFLAPFSDIDLAVIHTDLDTSVIKGLVANLFYPLWDHQLELSHTVKTLGEARVSARADLHWLTACLDARLIGGDPALFEELTKSINKIAARRSGAQFLTALTSAGRERRRRFGHGGRLLEPDLKESRGCLRDIQTMYWIEKALAPDNVKCRISSDERRLLREAEEFLCRLRYRLHEVSGRNSDNLLLEYHGEIADWFFAGDPDAHKLFSRRLYRHTRAVAQINQNFLKRCQAKNKGGADRVSRFDYKRLRRFPDQAVAALFEALDLEEEAVVDELELFSHTDVLESLIPEWRDISALTALDANHIYTVDTHSFYTVARLRGFSRSTEPLISDVYHEIIHPDWLLLGGLLHDIGKGQSQPHAVAGGPMASAVAARLGMDHHGRETIGFLVSQHLLLSRVATHRDLNDKQVIDGVAALVGDGDRLKMLYLLTVADALAMGPKAWNNWRSALVKELFLKVLGVLEGREGVGFTHEARLKEKHFELLDKEGETQIDFWPSESGISELAVVAPDRPGLFSRIAGVLALNGVSVLAVKVYTTDEGRALEVFKIAGVFEPEITVELFDCIRRDVAKAVAGRMALSYHLDELDQRYRKKNKIQSIVQVVVNNNASDNYTIIEVHAADEIGLLYKTTNALFELNLDIHLAKISTFGNEAIDVFYVSDLNGNKVTDSEHLCEIEKNILFRLRSTH